MTEDVLTGRKASPAVPHFSTFYGCDACGIRAHGTGGLPGGWAYESRPVDPRISTTLGSHLMICNECVPRLRDLRILAIDRLIEERGGLNAGLRWLPPGSPRLGPVCPQEIRDDNLRRARVDRLAMLEALELPDEKEKVEIANLRALLGSAYSAMLKLPPIKVVESVTGERFAVSAREDFSDDPPDWAAPF